MEMSSTGRRPKRSDSAPSTGENTNCISAQAVPKKPKISAARGVSPPSMLSISLGSTGMTMPSAMTSSSTMAKMKASAALGGAAAWAGVSIAHR